MEPTFIKNLTSRIKQNLPGKAAQKKMMIKTQIPIKPKFNKKKFKPAAVLILLYPFNDEWYFFLTKRTENVDHHKGQIALPGGMVEKNETIEEAAIRETYEEIGIYPKNIKIIGSLSSFYVTVSGFQIYPFLGWTNKKPKTKINDAEVEQIFSVSINTLIKKETKKYKNDILSGYPARIPYFDLKNEMVWGATSIILSEFKFILKDIS